MSVIKVENIEKHFGTVIANKNVSFELKKGRYPTLFNAPDKTISYTEAGK